MNAPIAHILAAVSLLVAGAAQADGDTPFYLGVAAGHVSVDRGSISLSAANNGGISGTATAASVLLGYEFSPSLGVELGYHDYGKPNAFVQSGALLADCESGAFACPKVSGVSAELLGRIELVPDLDGLLRAGILAWNAGSPGVTFLKDTSGNAFIYGIGVRKHFDYGLSFDITYERSNFTTEETRIGLSYSF